MLPPLKPHDHLIMQSTWGHVAIWKSQMYFTGLMATNLGKVLSYRRMFSMQPFNSSPASSLSSLTPSPQCFWTNCRNFLAKIITLVTKKACDQDLIHFLDTPIGVSAKIFPQVVIWNTWGTWQGLFTITGIHSVKQQVSQLICSRWQKIKESQQKEIELISKNIQRKRKDVQKKQLIGAPCEAI